MPFALKQTALRTLSQRPVYRMLPPGALRTCAALLYHTEHSPHETVTRRARAIGAIPTRYRTPAVAAARAAFRAGQDDLVDATLTELERRFPEQAKPLVLRCDLDTYHGRYESALRAARRARLLQPTLAPAAARAVRLGYRVLPHEEADEAAVAAVRTFPLASEVLWAVCKACESPEQFARIRATCEERVPQPGGQLRLVRPLALAAARAGDVDAAIDLYRQAITLMVENRLPAPAVPANTLGGRGAWHAIEDLRQALDDAGVPFFFAAGTALGLVRAGRPLSADSDIDVGVFDADWDRAALIDLFTRHSQFDLDPHPRTEKVGLRHRGGSPVDVFRYYPDGDRVWHDGVFVRWHNTPFEVARREVRGVALPLPADADRYLTENYGDWRTPNPAFDAFTGDAPNLQVTWPDYQRLHFLRRAYQKWTSGDHAGTREELGRAGEGELAGRG